MKKYSTIFEIFLLILLFCILDYGTRLVSKNQVEELSKSLTELSFNFSNIECSYISNICYIDSLNNNKNIIAKNIVFNGLNNIKSHQTTLVKLNISFDKIYIKTLDKEFKNVQFEVYISTLEQKTSIRIFNNIKKEDMYLETQWQYEFNPFSFDKFNTNLLNINNNFKFKSNVILNDDRNPLTFKYSEAFDKKIQQKLKENGNIKVNAELINGIFYIKEILN